MPHTAQNSGYHDARLAEAARLLALRAYREAHELCLDALKDNPASADAFYLLGLLTSDHENYAKAEELFRAAIGQRPDHAAALAQRARCLIALSRRGEAVETARAAARLAPADALTLDTIGVVLSRAGLHSEALPYYAKATGVEPGNSRFQYNHAAALQFAGEMDAARAAYRRCAQADPQDTRGLPAIVQITRQTASAHDVPAL